MNRYTLVSTVLLQVLFAHGAMAQTDGKDTRAYKIPAEHAEFVREFQDLRKRYPDAAKRYWLADHGAKPRQRVIIWECTTYPGGFEDCMPKPE